LIYRYSVDDAEYKSHLGKKLQSLPTPTVTVQSQSVGSMAVNV